MGLYENIRSNLNESTTEDYWDATEIARDGFMALLKFNFGLDNGGNNYIITNDNAERTRFYASNDDYAIQVYNDWKDNPNKFYNYAPGYDKLVDSEIFKKYLNESSTEVSATADNIFNIARDDYYNKIPSYEYYTDNYEDISKSEYNNAVKLVNKGLENARGNTYNGEGTDGEMLELNDNHTIWDLNNESIAASEYAWELWSEIVNRKLEDFKEETGVEAGCYGRSGRHICVDYNLENCLNFYDLQEVQERLEQEAIEEFNNYADKEYPEED